MKATERARNGHMMNSILYRLVFTLLSFTVWLSLFGEDGVTIDDVIEETLRALEQARIAKIAELEKRIGLGVINFNTHPSAVGLNFSLESDRNIFASMAHVPKLVRSETMVMVTHGDFLFGLSEEEISRLGLALEKSVAKDGLGVFAGGETKVFLMPQQRVE